MADGCPPYERALTLDSLGQDRRWRFAAGAAIPAVIAIALIAATSGGGAKTPAASTNPALPTLVSTFTDPPAGITVRLPAGWSASRTHQVVRLQSPDRSAIIALGAFPGAARAPTMLASAYVTARKAYPGLKLRRGPGTRLAGLPARSVVLSGRNGRGVPIKILLAAARGKKYAYVLDVFTASNTPGAVLVQAQAIISAMRLTR